MSTANLAMYGVAQGNIRQLFGEALVAVGQANPNVVVLDCQTAMPTAAVSFARAFPERFIDLGIAEQNAVSFAAGLVRMGFVPIVPLFACFSARRALDQVTIQVAYADMNVKVCGLYAGLTCAKRDRSGRPSFPLFVSGIGSETAGSGTERREGESPGSPGSLRGRLASRRHL